MVEALEALRAQTGQAQIFPMRGIAWVVRSWLYRCQVRGFTVPFTLSSQPVNHASTVSFPVGTVTPELTSTSSVRHVGGDRLAGRGVDRLAPAVAEAHAALPAAVGALGDATFTVSAATCLGLCL